jgi:hypothetical protein
MHANDHFWPALTMRLAECTPRDLEARNQWHMDDGEEDEGLL